MFCRYCGKEIEANSVFCEYCGKKLKVDQKQDGGRTSQRSSYYNANIKPEKKKKAKKSVGKGVLIVAIILVAAAGVYFIPKYWKPGDKPPKNNTVAEEKPEKQEKPEEQEKPEKQESNRENMTGSSVSDTELQKIIQSDRWIMGPMNDNDYVAYEFITDSGGQMDAAYLPEGVTTIPGWSSSEWIHLEEVVPFRYEVDDGWVFIEIYNGATGYLEMRIAIIFTVEGTDITEAYVEVQHSDGEIFETTAPVFADPDLQ